MSQIHNISLSLKNAMAAEPALVALFPDGAAGLQHGSRASLDANRPFGLLSIEELERVKNTSGVALVTYSVTLTVYADQRVNVVGNILEMFHRYWDRLVTLDRLDSDIARLVLIHPGTSELGEADEEDLGKDIIIGTTDWIFKLSEHQPEL